MNDTVKRIMQLADNYALQTKFDCTNTLTGKPTEAAPFHRKALQDELVRLFTPLKGQTFNTPDEAIAYLHGYAAAHDKYKIMGEKND